MLLEKVGQKGQFAKRLTITSLFSPSNTDNLGVMHKTDKPHELKFIEREWLS